MAYRALCGKSFSVTYGTNRTMLSLPGGQQPHTARTARASAGASERPGPLTYHPDPSPIKRAGPSFSFGKQVVHAGAAPGTLEH